MLIGFINSTRKRLEGAESGFFMDILYVRYFPGGNGLTTEIATAKTDIDIDVDIFPKYAAFTVYNNGLAVAQGREVVPLP